MPYRATRIGQMIRTNPTEAEKWLRKFLGECGGNVTTTARRLGVDVATLRRWMVRLPAVRDYVDAICGDALLGQRRRTAGTRVAQ